MFTSGTASAISGLTQFEEEVGLFCKLQDEADELDWNLAGREANKRTIIKLILGYSALCNFLSLRFSPGIKKITFLLQST